MAQSGRPATRDRFGDDLIAELERERRSGASLELLAARYGTTTGYVVALTDLFELTNPRPGAGPVD